MPFACSQTAAVVVAAAAASEVRGSCQLSVVHSTGEYETGRPAVHRKQGIFGIANILLPSYILFFPFEKVE